MGASDQAINSHWTVQSTWSYPCSFNSAYCIILFMLLLLSTGYFDTKLLYFIFRFFWVSITSVYWLMSQKSGDFMVFWEKIQKHCTQKSVWLHDLHSEVNASILISAGSIFSRNHLHNPFLLRTETNQDKLVNVFNFQVTYFPSADPGFLKKGFICIKVLGSICWFSIIYLNIPWKWNNLVSLRPNHFIFIGYLKTGTWRRSSEPPLDPLLFTITIYLRKPPMPK